MLCRRVGGGGMAARYEGPGAEMRQLYRLEQALGGVNRQRLFPAKGTMVSCEYTLTNR